MNDSLFDLDTVRMDSPRLVALREHDVQTHHAAHCDPPWMAIPMNAAREYLAKNYDAAPKELTDIPTITMCYARVLDDMDFVFTATTEREAQDLALERVMK